MEIKKIYRNEKDDILEVINNMQVEGCIDQFFDYLNVKPEKDTLENTFHNRLLNKMNDFCDSIVLFTLNDKKADDLEKIIVGLYKNGSVCYDQADYEDIRYFISYHISDKDAYNFIKDTMINCLNEIVKEKELSKQEKRKQELEYEIQDFEDRIKRYKDKIENSKKMLGNL